MQGALYRRFRPYTFDQVIGQEHIVRTLKNQIESGQLSHAYLFTGTRGTGKTSTAKIFARAVNCEHPVNGSACGTCETCKELANPSNLDIIEIDAASNNGVDEIRTLIDNARYRPSTGKYKVYIVDEVHMLSASAFNALLKTLEEPPEHVIFILATTEAHKLPQTVLSRCLRFDFRLVSVEELTLHLKRIFDDIGQKYELPALRLIAKHGEGSVRDTLSAADMLVAYANGVVTEALAETALGSTSFDTLAAIAANMISGDVAELLKSYDKSMREGKNPQNLAKDLGEFLMNVLYSESIDAKTLGTTDAEFVKLQALRSVSERKKLTRAIEILTSLEGELRYTTQPKLLVGAALVKAAELRTDFSNEATTARISALERELRSLKEGGFVAKATDSVKPLKAEKEAKETSEKLKQLLSEAKAVSEKPLFAAPEDEEEEKRRYEQHIRNQNLWSNVRAILKEREEFTLSAAAADVTEIRSGEDFLEVATPSKQAYELMTDTDRLKILKELTKTVLGADAEFRVLFIGDRSSSRSSVAGEEDKRILRDLFGSSLLKK